MPGTGWSTRHGDLRVAHFIGLHALQAFALFLLVLPRRWSARDRVRGVWVLSASYVALFGILLWQALRGQALIAPDALTAAVVVAWATLAASAFYLTNVRGREGDARRVHHAADLIGPARADNGARYTRMA